MSEVTRRELMPMGWLLAVARNLALMKLRQGSRQEQLEDEEPQPQQQIRTMIMMSHRQELFSKHMRDVHLTFLNLNYPMRVSCRMKLDHKNK